MSQFGSESDASSVKTVKIEEDFGDDVSILSNAEETNWGAVIFKVGLGLLFVCGCAGAIVYAIDKSEETDEHHNSTKANLPFDRSQSGHGVLHFFTRGVEKSTFSASVRWIQEADNRRMMYRVGNESQFHYALYLLSDVGYNETATGCSKVAGLNYDTFFDQMGLRYVDLKTNETVKIDGELEAVFVYEGEPNSKAVYYGLKPTLVRGFSPMSQQFILGFETYFDANSALFKTEHWMPEMGVNGGNPAVIDLIPHSCFAH